MLAAFNDHVSEFTFNGLAFLGIACVLYMLARLQQHYERNDP